MWVICPGDSVKGCVGACPQKDFTEVLLQRCEALFQVPSSVSLLFICYVLAGCAGGKQVVGGVSVVYDYKDKMPVEWEGKGLLASN